MNKTAENTLSNLKSNLSVLLGYFNESDLDIVVPQTNLENNEFDTYNQGK